jgi:uncharacterized protein
MMPMTEKGPAARVEPVVFVNRRGLRLFGILHLPSAESTAGVGVILLSPGVKMRVGPQGLYRRMADLFLSLGLPVLRFDYHGIGDSEGDLPEEFLKDVYNHVEIGRFVDDTLDAMNFLQERTGTRRFVLSGLCGGAMTGLLAASRDDRVAGLVGLGITPLVSSRAADPSVYFSAGHLEHLRKGYFKKLLSPSAWVRFLSLKSDHKVIWRSLMAPLKRVSAPGQAAEGAPAAPDNTNPLFPPAFFTMLSANRPMLLVFGGSDRLRWEFEEKFVARHKDRLAPLSAGYDLRVIDHANHVLTFTEWQRELLQLAEAWMRRHFLPA